jgi:hypothetical protein
MISDREIANITTIYGIPVKAELSVKNAAPQPIITAISVAFMSTITSWRSKFCRSNIPSFPRIFRQRIVLLLPCAAINFFSSSGVSFGRLSCLIDGRRQSFGVLVQDALHLQDRFRITLHGMTGANDLF